VLTDLGIRKKDTLLVLNKTDILESSEALTILLEKYPNAVAISAKRGIGLELLTARVSETLSKEFFDLTITMPIGNGRLEAMLAREGEVLSSNYDETSAVIHCRVPQHLVGQLRREKEIKIEGLPGEKGDGWKR
jgi:GTP-binding protein HflX